MVERTKRRTEELNTAMDDTESDVMEPDMPASGSEHEDNIDMINDQTEIDLARQQRSPSARSRKDSTSSGGQKKKATSVIKTQKQNPSERKSSVRECVECDSASVDSLKLNEECSPEQIMGKFFSSLNVLILFLLRLRSQNDANRHIENYALY